MSNLSAGVGGEHGAGGGEGQLGSREDTAPEIELPIAAERAFFYITKARAFQAKEHGAYDGDGPDADASNATDDGASGVLEITSDDATEQELSDFVEALNDEEREGLIALMLIGRGDYALEEWDDARADARDIPRARDVEYLVHTPLAPDHVENALAAFGLDLGDMAVNRL